MAKNRRTIDKRLLGTWKSDKRKTFQEFVPRRGAKKQAVRQFKALFGKLIISYTKTKYFTQLGSYRTEGDYEVLAKDSDSVAILSFDNLRGEDRIQHIHFEENHYWVWAWGMREFFRKIG